MSGNGNIVGPLTGNLNLRSSGNASSNAVFQVFGIPTNSNLAGLAGKAYDPQDATVRFTAPTVPTPSIGAPLSMNIFRGYALYASVPTVNVTLLTATTLTPNFTGGGGTTYYVAIGTSLGATNAQTTAWQALTNGTTALTLSPSLTVGTTYYVSGYGSNTNGTRTLAVSNTTSFVIPTTPTITGNVISNTTFTITAAVPANALSNVYSLYTQAGTFQSSNTTGTFTGLTSNTQYYVSVYAATAFTRSATSNSASVWCLAPATFGAVSYSFQNVTINWTNNTTAPGTSVRMRVSNAQGTATSDVIGFPSTSIVAVGSSSSSPPTWSSLTYKFTVYGILVTAFTITTSGTNTTYTSPVLSFISTIVAAVISLSPPANTLVTYTAKGANGYQSGIGLNGGIGARVDTSVTVGTSTTFSIHVGGYGSPAAANSLGPVSVCGDGTYTCSGGAAWQADGGGSSGGGIGGAGGAATVVRRSVGSTVVILNVCGGGGGVGNGGNQAGGAISRGGNGGSGSCSAGGFVPGGEGNATLNASNAFGHQGGWGGSQTISNRAGDWASPDPTTGYTAGAGGGGYRGTVNFVSSTAYGSNGAAWTADNGGGGGTGVNFYGAVSGGGGGGYGGGGSGTSTNQGSTAIAGGGGGGGSYAAAACTYTVTDTGLAGLGFAYYIT